MIKKNLLKKEIFKESESPLIYAQKKATYGVLDE